MNPDHSEPPESALLPLQYPIRISFEFGRVDNEAKMVETG